MILKKIALSNFTVFSEKQEIDLGPQDTQRPLILIKGHNGSGKTSILTGIQIALFGKRTVSILAEKKGYSEFLEGITSNKQAASFVSLDFEIYHHGALEKYHILREWGLTSRGKNYEEFSVYKNGVKDPVLEEAWDDFVDTIIPISIATLFFFDGERIADLATKDGIKSLLKIGIHSLLGINMLNQLHTDLGFILKRKIKEDKSESDDNTIFIIERELEEIKQQLAYLNGEISLTQNDFNFISSQLTATNVKFKSSGANFFVDRICIEKKYEQARASVAASNERLLELATGALPLALIGERTKHVVGQAQKEAAAGSAKQLIDVVEEWTKKIFELMKPVEGANAISVQNFLNEEKAKYQELANINVILNLPVDVSRQIISIEKSIIEAIEKARDELLNFELALTSLEEASRLKAMIPSEESVKLVVIEREQLLEQQRIARETLVVLQRKRDQLEATFRFKNQEHLRLLRKIAENKTAETKDRRVLRYAQKAQLVVEELTNRVVEHSREHLELLIGESLQLLMRKQDFISSIKIDNQDFSLSLFGENGQLDIDRLSAGERQLIVISILWGLTKASGRPLPFIIDTPLGRLDSTHRDNLLEYFFPEASHQTILLATDTEITPTDYKKIEQFVSKNYGLRYNDMAKATQIETLVGVYND